MPWTLHREQQRDLFPSSDDLRAPGAERVWRVGGVLPTTGAFFFGGRHDDYFIGRLFTNIPTWERKDTKRLTGQSACIPSSRWLCRRSFFETSPSPGKPVVPTSFASHAHGYHGGLAIWRLRTAEESGDPEWEVNCFFYKSLNCYLLRQSRAGLLALL